MEYDEYNQDQALNVKAPNWFVSAIKEHVIRNSIKTNPYEFAMYLNLQWDSNQDWLTEPEIRNIIQRIGRGQNYPHLPDDKDWERAKPKDLAAIENFLTTLTIYLDDMTYFAGSPYESEKQIVKDSWDNFQAVLTTRGAKAIAECGGLLTIKNRWNESGKPFVLRDLRDAWNNNDDTPTQTPILLEPPREQATGMIGKIGDVSKLLTKKED